jgi:Cu(I)/Ag(I) efflux system periplasmic protein CusF
MKTPSLFISMALALTSATAAGVALASDAHAVHGKPAAPQVVAQANAELTEAEVRKVDMESKKITLKHAEIKSLEMPPMTMVFQVKDPAMLEKIKSGDKIKFAAEKLGSVYTVTVIELVK